MQNMWRKWGTTSRPIPDNMELVLDFDPKDYDLAILHIDQQCTDPRISKGLLFKEFKDLTQGMKRVVINHMTPYHDQYENDQCIQIIKEMVGSIPMIVNSRQAAAQWGWGTPIIHGMDPTEWHDLPKEPRAVACMSGGGMNKAYRRELLHATMDILRERGIELYWIMGNMKFQTVEEYKNFLGRSLVYVHLGWQSPMPRSRTEAMMSGCCIVSTRHHDWDQYIENGVNGFIIQDNPNAAADLIEDLITNRIKEAREIGQRGKQTAIEKLHIDRWAKDWEQFIHNLP